MDDDFQELVQLSEKRDEKSYAWLRYLILLASGALTVLVSLQSGKSQVGLAALCLKVAWGTLGLGILLASVSLFGETWIAREMVKQFVEEKKRRLSSDDQTPWRIVVRTPHILHWSERLAYISLIAALISLVTFAILTT